MTIEQVLYYDVLFITLILKKWKWYTNDNVLVIIQGGGGTVHAATANDGAGSGAYAICCAMFHPNRLSKQFTGIVDGSY